MEHSAQFEPTLLHIGTYSNYSHGVQEGQLWRYCNSRSIVGHGFAIYKVT